jgi:hypothetical protein
MSIIWPYFKNNIQYAEVRTSKRELGKNYPLSTSVYLGRVIDKEQGIFENKKRGIFKYTLDSGFEMIDLPELPFLKHYKEKEILDFGASFLLVEFLKTIDIWDLFRETLAKYNDSLMALLFYYIESHSSNRDAFRWLRGSSSSLLFPQAQLQSQRISELLEKVGDETIVRDFLSRYLKITLPQGRKTAIVVDSSGAPNAIHFPLTAVSNHNGEIHEEIRIIYVIDTKTGLPLFFRYNAGNIVDVSTLRATLQELDEYGVSVEHALLDAGYCSQNNIKDMYDNKIKFMTRIPCNRLLFTTLFDKYRKIVLSDLCGYTYGDRYLGIKRIFTSIYGHRGYLYLCVDHDKRTKLKKHYTDGAISEKVPRTQWYKYTNKMGFFGLISSEKLEPEEVLPLYYQRQMVEQIFDISKNNIQLTPLRTHSEETFRGHIMLSFMATIIYLKINHCFKNDKTFTAENALLEMRNLKCKVFDDRILVKEPNKDMKHICKVLGIKIPEKLELPLKNI